MIKTVSSCRFFIGFLVGVFSIFYLSIPAFSEDVTLGWDPNGEPGLAGYGVYLGTEADAYELYGYIDVLDFEDPQNPSFTVSGLTAGEVYAIALTAYNAAGDESGFSAPACLEVGSGPVDCSLLAADAPSEGGSEVASSGGGGGSGGGGCFVWAAAEPTQDQNALSPLSLVAVWFLSGLTVLVGCRRFAFLFKNSKPSK